MTYPETILADAPSSYWRLGEAALPLVNQVGGGPSFTQDTAGVLLDQAGGLEVDDDGALRFQGAGLLVTPSSQASLNLGDLFSIEFWWRRDPTMPEVSIEMISKGSSGSYRVRYSFSTERLQVGLGATPFIQVLVPDDDWHHYVFTKNGIVSKAYRDGQDQTEALTNQTLTNNTSSLRLGGTSSPGVAYGDLDELALYQTELSLAQVAAHYDAGLIPPNPAPMTSVGPFSSAVWPDAQAVAGAADSTFRKLIPPDPEVHPDSDIMIANLLATGGINVGPGHIVVNTDTAADVDIPLYFATDTDPLWTILADNEPYGIFPFDDTQLRIPDGAKPAPGVDKHLSVVQPDGSCWDFYKVTNTDFLASDPSRILHCRWGGYRDDYFTHQTPVMNWGGSIAPNWLAYVGQIRGAELAAGSIDHALVCTIRCCGNEYAWPAQKNAFMCLNMDPPESEVDKVGMGHRIQLDYTDEEIDAMAAPQWRKTIWKAMARYGIIPGDTNGSAWQLRKECGTMYTAFGYDDPLQTFAKERYRAGDAGIVVNTSGNYVLIVREGGIDWNRLRVVKAGITTRLAFVNGSWREA